MSDETGSQPQSELLGLLRSGTNAWNIGMINGPNMRNLGKRDQKIYGDVLTLADLESRVRELGTALGVQVEAMSSNYEGEILDWIHGQTDDFDGLIINPAGLTLFGQPTRHALQDTGLPVIEVHFANIVRHGYASIFSQSMVGTVHGLRKHGYAGALISMVAMLDDGDFEAPDLYEKRVLRAGSR